MRSLAASSQVMVVGDSGPYSIAEAASVPEPPDCFVSDVYAARHLPGLPTSLQEANDQFRTSEFARAAFGDDVVDHYAHFFAY
ncbi:MAG: glutamine synthetase [Acidobacteria bacterium]|nr:glutamine synthetase [Acidobacteriota bacterium]